MPGPLTQPEITAGAVRVGTEFGREVVYWRDGSWSFRDSFAGAS